MYSSNIPGTLASMLSIVSEPGSLRSRGANGPARPTPSCAEVLERVTSQRFSAHLAVDSLSKTSRNRITRADSSGRAASIARARSGELAARNVRAVGVNRARMRSKTYR